MNLAGALPLFAAIPEAARALSPHVNLDTVHDLRTAGRDASARACLAQKTGVSLGQLENWVIQADLLELHVQLDSVPGISLEESKALTSLGLDGLQGLCRLSDEGLYAMVRRWADMDQEQDVEHYAERLHQLRNLAQKCFAQENKESIVVTHPHNLLIVSDLHLSQGNAQPNGKMDRNEDFLYDEDFANLLLYQQSKRQQAAGLGTCEDRPWRLILNGDVVDFLQVTGAPAQDVAALEQAINEQLGSDFLPATDQRAVQPPNPGNDELSKFFDRLNKPREQLVFLRQHLKDSTATDSRFSLSLCQLKAEADILISAGDDKLDTNRLTDLEELLRIPSELDEMTQQLNRIQFKETLEPKPDIESDKGVVSASASKSGQVAKLSTSLDPQQENFLKNLAKKISECLKDEANEQLTDKKKKRLTPAETAYLAQQIGTAWTLLATGRFSPDLLRLQGDLGQLFTLASDDDPLTPGVWWPKYVKQLQKTVQLAKNEPRQDSPELYTAFARYRDLLARYWAKQATLGDSIANLPQYQVAAKHIADRLRQLFEHTFIEVPQWRVGEENPYTLRYEVSRWGLGSSQAENVWRMHQIYRGHPVFFQALAWFVAQGNDIIIQTGNHDIELFWTAVRDALRQVLVLANTTLDSPGWQALAAPYQPADLQAQVMTGSEIKERVHFTHWLYYEPGVAYVEHGCQYETANSWPTYLDPRYVGTVADHQVRLEKSDTVPGQVEQPSLFWPWGSLIVRYIFNQMEQIHPFADQIKPMTRYFTWAFSRDFLRSLGLLFLSLPGILRVADQILDRGVIEGWFGPSYTLSGLPNIILRGASTWLTWLHRFLRLEWLTVAGRRRLRWPILPWPAWEQIVAGDKKRQQVLAKQLPDFYRQPGEIEKAVLDTDFLSVTVASSSSQFWTSLWQRLLEITLQIVFFLLLLGAASWLAGWQLTTQFGLLSQIGVPRQVECQTLALLPTSAPQTLLAFLHSSRTWPILLLFVLFGGFVRLQLTHLSSIRLKLAAALTALVGTCLTIYLLTNLYCGFAYYHLPEPGPWASFTALPTWLVWVLLFLVATLVLRRRVDDRRLQQKLRQLRQNRLLTKELGLRRFVSWLISLLGVAVLAVFFIYYTQPPEQLVSPSWLSVVSWLLLIAWLTLASFWWGNTVLMLFFVASASLGFMALLARLLSALNVQTPSLSFWQLLWPLLGGLWLYAWLPRKLPVWLRGVTRLVMLIGLILQGLLWMLSWSDLFSNFYKLSGWENLLPLWLLWGFIGLWLLESKENPFDPPAFQGWLGDWLTSLGESRGWPIDKSWNWLRPILDNTLNLMIETGLLLLLLAVMAQVYALRVQVVPGLLADFTGDRTVIVRLMVLIFSLLLIGIGGRNLLGWLQTDHFPARLAHWRQRSQWKLELPLGLALFGLIGGALWLATGPSLLNQTGTGLIAAAALILLGLAGWFNQARQQLVPVDEKSLQPSGPYYLLVISWLGLLALWLQTVRNLSQPNPPALSPSLRLAWFGLTLVLLVALTRLARHAQTNPTTRQPAPFRPGLLQATAWGLLLLGGALATAVLLRAGLGRPFPNFVSNDTALVAELDVLDSEVQGALFNLRLEQALRLSYDPDSLDRTTAAYLSRLQGQDVRTHVYFTALASQLENLAHAQAELLDNVVVISQHGDPELQMQLQTISETLQLPVTAGEGLAYPLLQQQTAALTTYFVEHPAYHASPRILTHPEAVLAEQAAALAVLAQNWEQLTDQAVADCLAATETPAAPADCARQLAGIWEIRYQPGMLDIFINRLNQQEIATDEALARVAHRLGGLSELPAPGLGQQLDLVLWRAFYNVPETTSLTASISQLTETQLDPQLRLLDSQRRAQLRALQALQQFAHPRRQGDWHTNLVAFGLLTLAWLSLGGFLLLLLLQRLARWKAKKLDSSAQLERIVALGRRQQSGFVRKFTRTATVVLSFTFGAGLFVGAYLVVTGLFTGDFLLALRSGAVLTIISWLGRRAVLFLPASASHGHGFLTQAAAEIQATLERGQPGQTALYPVPYYFFGHDHVAAYELIGSQPNVLPSATSQRQGAWYVNTGAWVQAYTGEVRSRREDEEYSIFAEIVPGPETTGRGVPPRLLRWDRAAARPNQLFHLVETVPESLLKRILQTWLRWLGYRQTY